MSTVTIDTTSDVTIAASVAALDYGLRHRLTRALRDAESAETGTFILDTIREKLAEQAPGKTAVGALFDTMDYDNGHFLTDFGTVLFDDGTTDEIEFGIDDQLTEEYGCVGENFTLAVDLRTGELDADDYRDGDIHTAFGIAKPPAEVSPADTALLGSILYGDREAGLGRYRVERFTTIPTQVTEHRAAVLVSDSPGALDFVCLTCSLTGFANTNSDTTDAAIRSWHR